MPSFSQHFNTCSSITVPRLWKKNSNMTRFCYNKKNNVLHFTGYTKRVVYLRQKGCCVKPNTAQPLNNTWEMIPISRSSTHIFQVENFVLHLIPISCYLLWIEYKLGVQWHASLKILANNKCKCFSINLPIPSLLYGAKHPNVIMYSRLASSVWSIRQQTAPTTMSL